MTAYLLTNHLLNFMAPAALVALLLVLLSRLFFKQKMPMIKTWWAQIAIVFIANLAILVGGLLFFGHDGKMLTYAALVLGAALCQWVLMRGWRL